MGGRPGRDLVAVNMGVKENIDLGFKGDFRVVGVEASEQQGGFAEIKLSGDGCS